MRNKTIMLLLILISLIFFSLLQAQEPGPSDRYVVSISLSQYEMLLKDHPPLDRLFYRDGNGYFLVNSTQLQKIQNIGIRILRIEPLPYIQKQSLNGDVNGKFHNYRESKEFLFSLAQKYPHRAQVTSIGKSVEGKDIYIIKISDNVTLEEQEPNLFIIGCHHAREWISVEVPLLFAQYLLEHFDDNSEVQRAVKGSQIYILPILNPDGLEFSIHTYRWWRKNRRYNGDFLWGVDLNRNYGYMWGYDDQGSSPQAESDVYRGASAFSEPETSAVQRFLFQHPPAGAISYHNYSEVILFPWGYTNELPPDYQELRQIAIKMSDLISQVNGRLYKYGGGDSLLYNTNGDTTDWIYGTFRVPAYTIELPPPGFPLGYLNGGFFTAQTAITPIFNENLPALLYFVNYFIKDNTTKPLKQKNPGKESSSKQRVYK